MTFLVDTHIFLWALAEPEKISEARRRAIEDPTNVPLISSISITEIVIKQSLGKLKVNGDVVAAARDAGFDLIGYKPEEALLLGQLPYHHKDPFDRMLIAQAIYNSYPVMTNDAAFAGYECALL